MENCKILNQKIIDAEGNLSFEKQSLEGKVKTKTRNLFSESNVPISFKLMKRYINQLRRIYLSGIKEDRKILLNCYKYS